MFTTHSHKCGSIVDYPSIKCGEPAETVIVPHDAWHTWYQCAEHIRPTSKPIGT